MDMNINSNTDKYLIGIDQIKCIFFVKQTHKNDTGAN